MPLTDHAPKTLRFIFSSCAAVATSNPLTATQRAAIIMALHDPEWVPTVAEIPETWAAVKAWHTELKHRPHIDVIVHTEEPVS